MLSRKDFHDKFYYLPVVTQPYLRINNFGDFLTIGDRFIALRIADEGTEFSNRVYFRYRRQHSIQLTITKVKNRDYKWIVNNFAEYRDNIGLCELLAEIISYADYTTFDIIYALQDDNDKKYMALWTIRSGRLDLLLHIQEKYGYDKAKIHHLLTKWEDRFWGEIRLDELYHEKMWHFLFDNKYVTVDDIKIDEITLEGWEDHILKHCGDSEKLYQTIVYGTLKEVKFLISYGADPQESCGLPLLTAIHYNKYDIAYYLIHDLGVYIHYNNELALKYACLLKGTPDEEMIALLPQHGASAGINNNYIIKEAAKKGRWNICLLLIRYGADYTVLKEEQLQNIQFLCMIRNLDI